MIQELDPESSSHETVDLGNDSSNLEFTSHLSRNQPEIQQATSSINGGPDSNISGPKRPQPQTGSTNRGMFSFSAVRNIFQRSSVSYSLLGTCQQWLEKYHCTLRYPRPIIRYRICVSIFLNI